MYDLPEFNSKDFKNKLLWLANNKTLQATFLLAIIMVAVGFISGKISLYSIQGQYDMLSQRLENSFSQSSIAPDERYISTITYEQAIIDAVKNASPSVVSIVISKNLPVYEQQFINPFGNYGPFDFQIPQYVQRGTQKQEVGAGSGFIVSEDGLVLTNKHVVIDQEAEYTVLTSDGEKYPAKVLALDPVQDLAIIKINSDKQFKAIALGDSSSIQIGQGAIAIGYALGEFKNTVSVGVISGLERTVAASGQEGFSEVLEDVIQTDAAINPGNSGGPLLNLRGEVIGVNTAMAQGAQTIGFAIPINIAKRDINQVVKTNKITYPFLGVRYVVVTEAIQEKYHLSVDYGVLLLQGSSGEPAITLGSAAEKAGLRENDVILALNGEKITQDNSLTSLMASYSPGDTVTLLVLREGKEITVEVVLGERN